MSGAMGLPGACQAESREQPTAQQREGTSGHRKRIRGRARECGGSDAYRQHFAEYVQNKELLTDVPGNKIFIVT